MEAGEFPGAVWLIARDGQTVAGGALGWAQVEPRRRRATSRTLFDLASLTKPLATASLAVLLARDGVVDLEEPVRRHLKELDGCSYGRATLLDLLVHRSGLPAWEPFYLFAGDIGGYLHRMAELPPLGEPGEEIVYSDPGYIAAGALLERAAGRPLERLFRRHVLDSCALAEPRFRLPARRRSRAAATEAGTQYEQVLVARLVEAGGASRDEWGIKSGHRYEGWRQEVIRGVVHDQNSHVLGGISGHSGLFGTAAGVAALAAQFLPAPEPPPGGAEAAARLFRAQELRLLTGSLTPGGAEERSAGFQVAVSTTTAAGEALSRRSFGHVGYTGTSLYLDPESRAIYVLLTNRHHPRHRDMGRMKELRQEFHRRGAALVAGSRPGPGR